jgi:threonine synthase
MDFILACTRCHEEEDNPAAFRCSGCGGILEVQYTSKGTLKNFGKGKINQDRYLQMLPIEKYAVREGGGGTPLLEVDEGFPGDARVLLKLETKNPTNSFKDRGSVVEISRAVELGFGSVVCASTGNMGMSVAYYAREAGLGATVYMSKGGNKNKMQKIREYGGTVVTVDGDFNDAMRLAERESVAKSAFVCGDYHFRKEGQKTLMFELVEQLKGKSPDAVFLPVGNSTLLAAAYKALSELLYLNEMDRMPRLYAVQSEECAPLVKAYRTGKEISYERPNTVADAIAVGYPTFGFEGIRGVKETFGDAIAVPDKDILEAVKRLKMLGVGAEPGGAAAFAGLLNVIKNEQHLFDGKTVVVPVTGNNE